MRVFFRDEKGKFLSRKDFAATEPKIRISEVLKNYVDAEENLRKLRAVEIEKIAAMCAAATSKSWRMDTTVNLQLSESGGLMVYGPAALDYPLHQLFLKIVDLLNARIKEQAEFVEWSLQTSSEV